MSFARGRDFHQTTVRTLILLSIVFTTFRTSVPVRQDRDGVDFSISGNVDVALFNVSVTDSKGRHVSGLKISDFRVLENGHAQDIQLFSAEDVPATIGLVMDNSGSMRSKRTDVQRAALAFIAASNPADELFLVAFNEKAYMGLPEKLRFTSDPGQFQFALMQMNPGGLTALYDATAVALDHLKTGTRDRKALVILSDGGDNASRRKLDDLLDTSRRSSATVYTIGIYDENDPDRNPRVLRKIADSSGGRAYFPRSLAHLDEVWREIAGEIRSQYTIGYVPRKSSMGSGSYRSVKIVATYNGGKPLNVTTREGYVLPEN
jgi:Ca-activated chloride channel family protein